MIARSNIWHGKLTSLSNSLPRSEAPMTPPFSRRFILAGASLSAASLLIPIVVRETRALPRGIEDYEITDWIIVAANGKVTLGLSQPEVGRDRTRPFRKFSQRSSTRIGSMSQCAL